MSYLDIPRIHFAGRFFTDPSTVNNDPTHYNDDVTKPSPWQNPIGQHRFEFRDCKIMSAVGANGFITDDTIIGTNIITTNQPESARIVDLDVYQQAVSTLYGMQLQLQVGNAVITGLLDPAELNLVWINCVIPTRSWEPDDYDQDSFGGDMNSCGAFQSVLRVDFSSWPTTTTSQVLKDLQSATLVQNGQYLISVRFTLDGYQNVPQDKDYLTGRIVGTLGPVFAKEPLYSPGGRWLMPRNWAKTDPWYWPSFNNCPFKVDAARNVLTIDFSNSICRQTAGGPPVDLGNLFASIDTREPAILELGNVDYSDFAYNNNAQVTEFKLTPVQTAALQQGFLRLTSSQKDIGQSLVLSEPTDTPIQFAAEQRVIRMAGQPGTTTTIRVYVSQMGKPLAGKQLAVIIESVHGDTPGATVPPTNPGDTPQADGALEASISPSDANGFAEVTLLVAKDPGQRTPELDGQLYFIIVFDPDLPHSDWSVPNTPPPPQDKTISCVVFSDYQVNTNPQWSEIQAMFAPYMKLYPFMASLVNLTDQHTFTIFAKNPNWAAYGAQPGRLGIDAGAIPYYLTMDFNDPRYMPISRDLSDAKLLTTLYFIKNLQQTSAGDEQKSAS
ncbi:MAG: hypothetical protein QM764_07300 [Chitinophagaceae bacterium]